MEVISSERLDDSTGLCSICDARPVTMFNWRLASSRGEPELKALRKHLEVDMKLKSGKLLRCGLCGQGWYLDAADTMATRVPRNRESLLRDWNARSLVLSPDHRAAVSAIGAIGADHYGNGRGYLHVPCAIDWAEGTTSDPCMLLITGLPPISETQEHVRLFEEVANLHPSDFALPLDVRRATRMADELHMGWAPTWVEDPIGRILMLNWSADVFEYEGIRGKDIRLTRKRWTASEHPPSVSEPRDRIVYVYADR